jgi:hypothetical protein
MNEFFGGRRMDVRKVAALGVMLLANRLMFADASYQESSQITGGAMVDSLKQVSFLGGKAMKDMFAPNTTTTMVHGNQKAVVSKESTEITDLDKETITHIDTVHKTYSVVTFAQMRQAFQNMPQQLEQARDKVKQEQAQQPAPPKTDLKTSFDVSVKNTGVTKVINGLTAQEQVVTLQMHVTDPNAPPTQAVNSMTYVVTTDAWISADPPEVKELQDFDKRFAQKLMAGVDMSAWKAQMTRQNPGMAQMFGNNPGSGEAMAQMAKEMAKLQGTRVMEVTRMGGSGSGPGAAQASAQNSATPAAPANSGGSVAGQVATDTAAQTAAAEASRLGVFGSALGSSALGAFHRKKAATPAPAPATTTAASPNSASAGTQSATLMEMTMQKSNFSQDAIPSSAFQVPAGFTKVDSPAYGATAR